MGDGDRNDDGDRDEMIEIGDPSEDVTHLEPPPKVIIQYRDRGIPWMLLPALLMLSAILTIYAYRTFQPVVVIRPNPAPQVALMTPEPMTPVTPVPPPTVATLTPEKTAEPTVVQVDPPPNTSALPPSTAAPLPGDPGLPPVDEVKSTPKVTGLGFDPKALEADAKADAPIDSLLDPASQAGRRGDDPPAHERAPVGSSDDRAKPTEVDAELLPPDPRLARQFRAHRQEEARRQLNVDRVQFHADLLAIVQNYKEKSGPEISALIKRYGTDIDPEAKQLAMKHLGKTGRYAGASRPVRINLLRSVGFPETGIFSDLCENIIRHELGREDPSVGYIGANSRNGFRTEDEVVYQAALILLKFPPPSMPSTPTGPLARPRADGDGDASPNPNPGRAPAR